MNPVRSIGILTFINAVGALIGLVYTILVAYYFGTQRVLEVFFAASTLIMLVTQLTQSGQIAELLLPIYHQAQQDEDREKAFRIFSVVFNWTMVIVAGITLLSMSAAYWLVALYVPGFSEEDKALGARMFCYLAPLVLFSVGLSQISALANAEKQFGRPEAWALAGSIAGIGAVALLARTMGVWILVWSLWVRSLTNGLGFMLMLRRMGYRHRFILREPGFSASSFFFKLVSTFGQVGAQQIFMYVLSAQLSWLPQGVYGVYRYAERLYDRSMGVVIRPVFVVFFTQISLALAAGGEEVRRLMTLCLRRSLMIVCLLVASMSVAIYPILTAVLSFKHYETEDTNLTARLVLIMFIILGAKAYYMMGRKTVMALRMVHRFNLFFAGAYLLAAACAWVFISRWQMNGVIAALFSEGLLLAVAPALVLAIWQRHLLVFPPLGLLIRWTLAVLVGYGVGYALERFVPSIHFIPRLTDIIRGGILAAGSVGAAFGTAWLLNIHEVRETVRRVCRRLPRMRRAEGPTASKEN